MLRNPGKRRAKCRSARANSKPWNKAVLGASLPPGVVVIGTICGSLSAKSTPVSCSLISRFSREETMAWPPAMMICGSLQNDVDVLLAARDVRAALDIPKSELYAEVRRCAKTT